MMTKIEGSVKSDFKDVLLKPKRSTIKSRSQRMPKASLKQRRFTSRDLSQFGAWRLLMCLKSGLLAESSWALDVLTVMIHDDKTYLLFRLQKMPGLLDTLLEHYKKYLSEIFEGGQTVSTHAINALNEGLPTGKPLLLLNGSLNFTWETRDGKPVKMVTCKKSQELLHGTEARTPDPESSIHADSGDIESSPNCDWDPSCHIVTHFACKEKFVRFVKLIKTSPSSLNSTSPSSSGLKSEQQVPYPRLKPGCKRKKQHDLFDELEEEAYHRDHPPLYAVDEYCEGLAKRCLCLSTLIRNLSFVPGNDVDMAQHPGLLMVLSRLLLLNHEHSRRKEQLQMNKNIPKEESLLHERDMNGKVVNKTESPVECDDSSAESDIDTGSDEWYWDTMHLILENSLVTLANLSGQLDLTPFPEEVSLPLLDGLLHWAVCPSAYAQDHLPTTSLANLSPQRLALETLVKLSIREVNVDLILATPPWERLDRLFKMLPKLLSRNEDQTLREFALVLLVNLTSADALIARAVALTGNAIPQLVSFVEMSEQSAMNVAHTHGVNALRENPELMGTTLDMVRRAALCLRSMSRVPENRPLFMVFQQRLLNLVMSQILDQGVAAIMADVVYECSLNKDSYF